MKRQELTFSNILKNKGKQIVCEGRCSNSGWEYNLKLAKQMGM